MNMRLSTIGSARSKLRLLRGLTVILAASMALALNACSANGSSGPANGSSRPATPSLKIGLSSEPPMLKAGADQGTAAEILNSIMQRGLLSYDDNGQLVNALAESHKQVDPTTMEFHLRKGLTFQDGSPLTSKNVKQTLEYLADPANSARDFSAMSDISLIETPDDTTVIIKLKSPNAAFLEYLAEPAAGIVPESALKNGAANTVGAGPFKLSDYQKGVAMTFVKFDGYYDASEVKLNNLKVDFYPDGQARTNALRNGDVDLIDYVPWENFDVIKSDSNLVLDSQPGTFMYLVFNISKKGPFANPKVREAVAYAVDRNKIVQSVFSGYGKALGGMPIPESSPFYDASRTSTWKFDPRKAKELLAEAGYPNGFDATILASSQYAFHQDTAVSVQADLKAVGINLKLDSPDWATRIQKGNAGDYDVAVNGTGGIVNDPSFLADLLIGPPSYRRPFGYQDQETTDLLAKGTSTLDTKTRKQIYAELENHLLQTAPIVSLTTREQGFAYNKNVKGFKNLPGFLSFYSGYSLAGTSIASN